MRSPFAISATLAACALCALSSPGLSAGNDFLAPEKAFAYLIESDGAQLTVYWNVAPGYYLYRSRMSLESATPGVVIGAALYPEGKLYHDEFFGDQLIFRDDFTVTAPLDRGDSPVREITVWVKWQGCADAGFCYPPTTWEAKVTLPLPPQ